jgi:hypothetical protein
MVIYVGVALTFLSTVGLSTTLASALSSTVEPVDNSESLSSGKTFDIFVVG